ELGGKNPCIVDQTADLAIAARRIAWGKFINAGQTCIAPDYLLVHESVRADFMELLRVEITRAYGDEPLHSPDYARIIDDRNFVRLSNMLEGENIYYGGITDPASRYVSPTIIDGVRADSMLMDHEVFGPILPVIPYSNENQISQ